MEQTEEKLLVDGARKHKNTGADVPQSTHDSSRSTTGDTFLCEYKNHWVPRSEAAKTGKNPSICRTCAADKRERRRQKEEHARAEKLATLDEIPAPESRGATKRVTYSLHQYVVTALDVLAVGTAPSDVVERAIIRFLEEQDPQVIAFVNRMFGQATSV